MQARSAAYLLLSLTMLFWAGNAVVARAAALGALIPPISLSFWRWTIALAILLPIGIPRVIRQRDLHLRHWRRIAVLGLLSVSTFNTCQYVALTTTTAMNFGAVNAIMPVAIVLLNWVLGRERASARQLMGLVAALAGVLYVVARGEPRALLALDFNRGDLFVLLGVSAWALYSVLLRELSPRFDALGLLTVLVGFGLAGIGPFYAWELSTGARFSLNTEVVLVLAYVGVFPSVLAVVFWNSAIRIAGANFAGTFINVLPVFISVLAIGLLGERVARYHVIGVALIFCGIYLAIRRGPPSRGAAR